jgi:hypothetical protein
MKKIFRTKFYLCKPYKLLDFMFTIFYLTFILSTATTTEDGVKKFVL